MKMCWGKAKALEILTPKEDEKTLQIILVYLKGHFLKSLSAMRYFPSYELQLLVYQTDLRLFN